MNETYAGAHEAQSELTSLSAPFAEAQRLLGARVIAQTGEPKRSLLGLYFRWAAIDGMTDPFFLEIIVNPDVLPVERPFVVAHEWAHLAGYADESEANFVAWLTCAHGDARARYSGWLALYAHLSDALPRDERRALADLLAPGPRQDLVAINARLLRSAPVVRRAARDVYDSYLKANRVEPASRATTRWSGSCWGFDSTPGGSPEQRPSEPTRLGIRMRFLNLGITKVVHPAGQLRAGNCLLAPVPDLQRPGSMRATAQLRVGNASQIVAAGVPIVA